MIFRRMFILWALKNDSPFLLISSIFLNNSPFFLILNNVFRLPLVLLPSYFVAYNPPFLILWADHYV